MVIPTPIHPIDALPSCWDCETIDHFHVVGIQVLVVKETAADEEAPAAGGLRGAATSTAPYGLGDDDRDATW